MGERHPYIEDLERIRKATMLKIMRLGNPAERARLIAEFDDWLKKEQKAVLKLVEAQERISTATFEAFRHEQPNKWF